MGAGKRELLTVGVDLGATNLRIAAYSPVAGLLETVAIPTRIQAGPLGIVRDMCDAVERLIGAHVVAFGNVPIDDLGFLQAFAEIRQGKRAHA